jgi:hypothetical protein
MVGVTRLAYVLQHDDARVCSSVVVRHKRPAVWWLQQHRAATHCASVMVEREVGNYSCEKIGEMRKGMGTGQVGDKKCAGPLDTCCVRYAVK